MDEGIWLLCILTNNILYDIIKSIKTMLAGAYPKEEI